jgi:peptidoglycan/LPS O-acetylase OafA/YrhL
MSNNVARPDIPALTGLRGVAAYSVLLGHTLNFSMVNEPWITALAHFGMALFFVLSGFVIHYNYGSSFAARGTLPATRTFLWARFARLYPLYFVGLVLSIGWANDPAAFHHIGVALAALTMTHTWFNVNGGSEDVVGGSWSLSSEAFLYLLFIPAARILSGINRTTSALLLWCTASIGVIYAIYLYQQEIITGLSWFYLEPHTSAPIWLWVTYYSPLTRGLEFFAGAIAAQAVINQPDGKGANYATWMLLLCVAWCEIAVLISQSDNSFLGTLSPNFLFAPAIAPALILLSRYDTVWSRILSSRFALFCGEISYSVYLLQALVFGLLRGAFVQYGTPGLVLRVLYTLAYTTCLSYGTYRLFEAPARSWLRRLQARAPSFRAPAKTTTATEKTAAEASPLS